MRRALVTGDGYAPHHFARLRRAGLEVIHRAEISPDELQALLPSIDLHVLGGSERLDAALLDRAAQLRVISFVGTGIGSFVDVRAAEDRFIRPCNTPGVGTGAVAEHTIGLLLGLVRGLFAQNESVKRGSGPLPSADELGGLPVGILGMGPIAQRVARVLTESFGCSVLYANRSPKPAIDAELAIQRVDLQTLFADSAAVLVLVALSPETRGAVDRSLLMSGRKGKFLVNTAAASIVDPIGLRAAIASEAVRAAAFDGYWIEPLPAPGDDPYRLLELPDGRFFVTPHCAAKTPQTWNRMVDEAIDQAIDALDAR